MGCFEFAEIEIHFLRSLKVSLILLWPNYWHFSLQVRTIKVEKRINEIVNRLNKTKEERFPNLRDEREERDRQEREDGKQKLREQVQYPHAPPASSLSQFQPVSTLMLVNTTNTGRGVGGGGSYLVEKVVGTKRKRDGG